MKGSNPILVKLEQPRPGVPAFTSPLTVSGWVLTAVPIREVTVLVDGKAAGRAQLTGPRADVIAHYRADGDACGFRCELDVTFYRGRAIDVAAEAAGPQGAPSRSQPVRVAVPRRESPSFFYLLGQHLRHSPGGWPGALAGAVRAAWRGLWYFRQTGRVELPRPPADLAVMPRQAPRPLTAPETEALERRRVALKGRPRLSVIVPAAGAAGSELDRTLHSLWDQAYTHYELLLVGGPGQPRYGRAFAEEVNEALRRASGDFVTFVHPGDTLAPDALLLAAETLARHPQADGLYADEDTLEPDGTLSDPFYKPAWSPELLLCQHYIGQLALWRRELVMAAGGLRGDVGSAYEHDFALRVSEGAGEIVRLPHVLYHRARGRPAPAARDQVRAIEAALRRRGLAGVVRPSAVPGVCSLRLTSPEQPRVAIIIPTRDRAALLRRCVQSILRRTRYPNYEVLVINNDSREPQTLRLLASWAAHPAVRVLDFPGPFNYAAMNNVAVRATEAPLVLLLNNDTEVITPHWLGAMAGLIALPGVGAVGAKLYFYNDTIQHAGCVVGMGRKPAAHAHKFFPRHHPGYHGQLYATRNVAAVTGACLLTRRDLYLDIGGLDEELAVAHNDTDYCLQVRSRGYRIVWTPEAELYHYESATRTIDHRGDVRYEKEIRRLGQRWGAMLEDDPYYSPNLSLDASNFAPRARSAA